MGYFVNPSYPAADSEPAACSLVVKPARDTCWVSERKIPFSSRKHRCVDRFLRLLLVFNIYMSIWQKGCQNVKWQDERDG